MGASGGGGGGGGGGVCVCVCVCVWGGGGGGGRGGGRICEAISRHPLLWPACKPPDHDQSAHRWISARLQYFQCASNGNTAVLHQAIVMCVYNGSALDIIKGSYCTVTHHGLLTPYGDMDLRQYWFRLWLVAWRHQAIT